MLATLAAASAFWSPVSIAGKWNFSATDVKDTVVTGTITIEASSTNQPSGVGIHGFKKFIYTAKAKGWPKEFDPRSIGGTLTGNSLYLSLYGIDDNDIYLNGNVSGDRITGTWRHSTFAGTREHGTFTMTRAK